MDDDFQVPAVLPNPDPAAVSGGASTRTSKSSVSTAGSKGRAKLCGYPSCDEDCKCGRRHCGHHHRHLDNARNQVIRVKGEAAGKAFMEKCKNLEFANGQIEHMMKLSVGLPMFARAPLIDFVKWEQEFGVLVETKNAAQLRPFEQEQWIIRQVTKFGRDKEEMKEAWRQKLAGHWRRDYEGYKGSIRLWLPATEYEEKSNTQFVKGAAKEESKIKKSPKDFELEAFRRHAMEADLSHGHSFFNGGSVVPDEVGEDDGCGKDDKVAAEDAASSKEGVSPVKRKAAETLDASEDEGEACAAGSKKKPRKSGNLASARATLFDNLSKQMQAKCASIVAKMSEAEKVQNEESKAPTPTAETDVTTRKLYNASLAACLDMVKLWQDPAALKASVEKHNKDVAAKSEDGKSVDVAKEESIAEQGPALRWALQKAGKSLSLDRASFLRTSSFMNSFIKRISEEELDEEMLEKHRLMWRRMFACLGQLESSLKKSTLDVSKHVSSLANAVEKESKKRKDREAKEAAAKHIAAAQEKMKKAKADGSDMPDIFKLDKSTLVKALI